VRTSWRGFLQHKRKECAVEEPARSLEKERKTETKRWRLVFQTLEMARDERIPVWA
jgi:hypothetical protein